MKKKVLGFVTLATVLTLSLAGCGGNKSSDGGKKGTDKVEDLSFPLEVKNDEKAIDGGTLEVGVVTDTQFKGLFLWELYTDNYDAQFMKPSHMSLFSTDDSFKITNDGLASLDLNEENNTATIKLRKDLKWSDGEPLTADDVIFSYELIGHKDYTGVRYDSNFINIEGMTEYHEGKVDKISGIKKIDDLTTEIKYKEVHPGMLQAGGGIWSYAAPKHALKDIPVKDLESSDAVRKHPVSYGPYVMNKIVPGESVEYVPNEYYFEGKPKIDKVVLQSISAASATEALKSKQYDLVFSMPTDTYDSYKDVEGYQMLGQMDTAYTYLGFKLGKWDDKAQKVVMDPNAKMANKSLRQAMGYAINNDLIGEKFYHGLRENANSLIIPVFADVYDKGLKGYSEDLDKANKLLDDAGYKYAKEGDKYRQDPDGKELVIKFASMAGGETAQPIADYYIQQWEKIGLKVELTTGRLIDFQAFYDKLENDDPEIDIYQAAWNTGTDPSPMGLYGPNSQYNYTRFESEENTKLLEQIDSKESFDEAKRKEFFKEWQEYAADEAYVIPTLYRYAIIPTSNRVKDFSIANDVYGDFGKIVLTQEKR